MGKLFYDMGFLDTSDVIECSATDLLGQHVGQTATKTRKQLQDGLGRVLFIDEAPRLLYYNQFAAEAVDEIVHFLAQPANVGRMVVILAGRAEEMNMLMASRPVLCGQFAEEIVFGHIPPEECIALLVRELKRSGLGSEDGFLEDAHVASDGYRQVRRLFNVMTTLPTWSNARDVENLARRMIGRFLETRDGHVDSQQQLWKLSVVDVIGCMAEAIFQQKDRLEMAAAPGEQGVSGATWQGLVEARRAEAAPNGGSANGPPGRPQTAAEILRLQLATIQEELQDQRPVLERLQQMGRFSNGYSWTQV